MGAPALKYYDVTSGTWKYLLQGPKGDTGPAGAMGGPVSSVDSEIALFNGTSGTVLKRATGTGIVKITSGVLGTATAGTDYLVPGGILGTPSSGTLTNATGLPLTGLVASTSIAIGVGSVELGHATDTTLSRSAAGVLAVEGVVIPSISSTNTLTNKSITKRESTITSSATPTPNADTTDIFTITAQAAGAVFAAPTGTPTQGQQIILRIKDNATAQSLSWNAIYRGVTGDLPNTTAKSFTHYFLLTYNATDTKWDVLDFAASTWSTVNQSLSAHSATQGTGTWTTWFATAYPIFTGGLTNTSAATGDYIEIPIFLQAGVYKSTTGYRQGSDSGITDVTIDGAVAYTIDNYQGSNLAAVVSSTNIIILNTGVHKWRFTLNGKNASSSAIKLYLTGMTITRTS